MSDTERMLRDVHPAEVALSDGRLFVGVRAFLTNERLVIWKEDRATREIKNVLELKVKFTEAKPSRETLLDGQRIEVFSDEATATINRGRGCGCGSKLKALSPPTNWTRER